MQQRRSGRISFEDRELMGKNLTDKQKLRNMALKINKIPKIFQKRDGSLDLDKVHLALQDYQK